MYVYILHTLNLEFGCWMLYLISITHVICRIAANFKFGVWTPEHVKCTLVQALRLCTGRTAHRGSRGIALPFHDLGTRSGWEVSVKPRPLFTSGKTRYPLYRRLGGPQGWSVQVRKFSPPMGFNPRTVLPTASRYTAYVTRTWTCRGREIPYC